MQAKLREVRAVRFITPLREGGSLPGLIEGDDGSRFVVKFRGAGQGARALVAEVIVGGLARALGVAIPELALVALPAELGRNEADPEVRDLLLASVGQNVGLGFLEEALMFDPAAGVWPDAQTASRMVMLDAFVMNVDRTPRNPNLLWSHGRLFCIDHGAALYWHHAWNGGLEGFDRPFPLIAQHVLLPRADALEEAATWLQETLQNEVIEEAVAQTPPEWLLDRSPEDYVRYLAARRDTARFVQEAIHARQSL